MIKATVALLSEIVRANTQVVENLEGKLYAIEAEQIGLNDKSFLARTFERLLAVLTALALIPATVGGLLGMNVIDAPWPGTLAQVAFGVTAGMALSLYIFILKGWLR